MKNRATMFLMLIGISGGMLFSSCSANLAREFFDAAVKGATASFTDAVNDTFDGFLLQGTPGA